MAEQVFENPVKFVLVGANKGKSGVFGGFKFEAGVLTVEKDDEQKVAAIVTRFHNAVQEHKVEEATKEYEAAVAAARAASGASASTKATSGASGAAGSTPAK